MRAHVVVAAVAVSLVVPLAASAATLDVCPAACTYTTVAAALAAAVSGDVVSVAPGTYVETVALSIPSGVTLTGAGAGAVTIAGAAPAFPVRVGGVATISSVTLEGRAGVGALAISSASGRVDVIDAELQTTGAGVPATVVDDTGAGALALTGATLSGTASAALLRVSAGALTLDSVTVTCGAASRGLRFAGGSGNATITRSSFSGCDGRAGAGQGGAAFVSLAAGATLAVDASTFDGNVASDGGGLYLFASSTATSTITRSVFSNNRATSGVPFGGGLNVSAGRVSIDDSDFTANTTDGAGSAIAISGAGTNVSIVRSRFCGNLETSSGTGSTLRIDAGTVSVENTLFGGNQGFSIEGTTSVASITVDHSVFLRNQGGIFRRTTLTLTNSVLAFQNLYPSVGGLLSSGTSTIEYSLFHMNSSDPAPLSPTNVTGSDPGYFSVDAAMPCMSDLRVRTTSPLIDAGAPSAMDLDATRADIGLHGGARAPAMWWLDADADGEPYVYDCAPGDPDVYPGHVELCNGADDDCDLVTDDGLGLGASCSAGVGACARSGTVVCDAGMSGTACSATAGSPSAELCGTGMDEDCDGTNDEGFEGVGSTCSAGVGACMRSGTIACSADRLSASCDAVAGAAATELCGTGTDEDCDGASDEGFAGLGAACFAGVGDCTRSATNVCSVDRLSVVCGATAGAPSTETCNGTDEDCDGTADDGTLCSGVAAGSACIGAGVSGAFCGCSLDSDCASGRACDAASSTCVVVAVDAGSRTDAGPPPVDAGTDAGPSGTDAGPPDVDAGSAMDAGSAIDGGENDAGGGIDAGTVELDGGTVIADGGLDAGDRTDALVDRDATFGPDTGRPSDAGGGDGAIDAGAVPPTDAGCACRAGSATPRGAAVVASLAMLGVVLTRRRRRSRLAHR